MQWGALPPDSLRRRERWRPWGRSFQLRPVHFQEPLKGVHVGRVTVRPGRALGLGHLALRSISLLCLWAVIVGAAGRPSCSQRLLSWRGSVSQLRAAVCSALD